MSTPRQQKLDHWFTALDPGRIPETQDPLEFPLAHASQITDEWEQARHTADPHGEPAPGGEQSGHERGTWWRAGIVACGLVATGVLVWLSWTPVPDLGDAFGVQATETTVIDHTDASPTTTPADATTSSGGEASRCPTRTDGDLVRGNGAGGTGSGPEAVLAFEYAYYVARSGAHARAVTTPDAAVPAAQEIQRGIDSIPLGTTHCLTIAPLQDGGFAVELTEHRPDGSSSLERQTVSTVTRAGRVLITGITAR